MILVDTSIWIDHLRSGDDGLVASLEANQVLVHPFVLGELACGNLRRRTEVLELLKNLPQADTARNEEVLFFIDRHKMMGRGVGYVDVHLLASAALEGSTRLWTRDKSLRVVAERLKLAHPAA